MSGTDPGHPNCCNQASVNARYYTVGNTGYYIYADSYCMLPTVLHIVREFNVMPLGGAVGLPRHLIITH